MNLFLNKISKFVLFTFLALAILCTINLYVLNRAVTNVLNLGHVENLILGDSHMELGVNPEKIRKSINVASSSEPYSITYFKLKRILQQKHSIKNVLLGFSYHNFSTAQDSIIINKKSPNYSTFVDRYSFLDLDSTQNFESSEYYHYNSLTWKLGFPSFKILKINFKYIMGTLSIKDLPFIGGYQRIKPNTKIENKKILEGTCRHFENRVNNSVLQTKYLHKIIGLLKNKDIQLYLIGTPLQSDYISCLNPNMVRQYQELKYTLSTKNVYIKDFTTLPLNKNHFKDPHHLSGVGSDYFSEIIENEIFK